MDFSERQMLRNTILVKLYNIYFETRGIGEKRDKQELEKNTEEFLAYQYLIGKGLVICTPYGGEFLHYRITVYGIDIVESGKYIEMIH